MYRNFHQSVSGIWPVFKILLVGNKTAPINARFYVFQKDSFECYVRCEYLNKAITACESDFFESLLKLRLELEKDRLIPLCYGASVNVWASAMCRDGSAGIEAYYMRKGMPNEVINIFDYGDGVIPSRVEMQRLFMRQWKD